MESTEPVPPVVGIPAPVDRRLRLGPFPTARDAVKFVSYAAAAALLAPFVAPFAWIPLVLAGFAVSVWRPDGEAVDERAVRWVAWTLRRFVGGTVSPTGGATSGGRSFVRLGPGRYATILRTGGTPLAYRPPAELERIFREYGELLRVSDGVLVMRAGSAPLVPEPVLPPARPRTNGDVRAVEGYRELVTVLCRRRSLRRVDVALFASDADPGAPARLEARTRTLLDRLRALEVRPVRLHGHALHDAAHRFGWNLGRPGP